MSAIGEYLRCPVQSTVRRHHLCHLSPTLTGRDGTLAVRRCHCPRQSLRSTVHCARPPGQWLEAAGEVCLLPAVVVTGELPPPLPLFTEAALLV